MRGVGIDIAHIPRFAAALSRWGSERLCARILHPQEVPDFEAKCATSRAQFLASRLVSCSVIGVVDKTNVIVLDGRQRKLSSKQLVCIKCELLLQCLRATQFFPELPLSPRHISIFKLASGSPRARLHDSAAHAWQSKRSEVPALQGSADGMGPVVMLSLTHDGDYAAAVAFDE